MSYYRATQPYNDDAIAAANAAVAPETGGRPLTMGPEDEELRKKWMQAYQAAGGKVVEVSPSGKKPGDCVDPCPCKPISSITIISLTFKSDHKLLKDYTADWKDGGSRFPKPEWTTAHQHPVSHTMDKVVTVVVEIEVTPPDACPETGTLQGLGPNGMVFEKTGVSFAPGKKKIELTSDIKLEKKIQELDFKIDWSTIGTSVSIFPSQTSNTMFVTMDTPTTPRWPGITLKRMRHAVKATGAAGSLDPHEIVRFVMGKWSRFNLKQVYDNEWELADDATDPVTGDLIGADCQTIVRHTESVIRMVGCPGTAEFIVVWAKVPAPAVGKENPAYVPNMSSPKQWYNSFNPPDPAKATWRATLVDGDGGQNRYEACLKFTHGGIQKYYAGGVGRKDNVDEVIKVFATMSWRDDVTAVVVGVIFTY